MAVKYKTQRFFSSLYFDLPRHLLPNRPAIDSEIDQKPTSTKSYFLKCIWRREEAQACPLQKPLQYLCHKKKKKKSIMLNLSCNATLVITTVTII